MTEESHSSDSQSLLFSMIAAIIFGLIVWIIVFFILHLIGTTWFGLSESGSFTVGIPVGAFFGYELGKSVWRRFYSPTAAAD